MIRFTASEPAAVFFLVFHRRFHAVCTVKKNATGQIPWKSASRCVAMVRGKNGTNPAVGGGSNGLRGYKLLRLPMVAGSPITRTGDEREICPKKA